MSDIRKVKHRTGEGLHSFFPNSRAWRREQERLEKKKNKMKQKR